MTSTERGESRTASTDIAGEYEAAGLAAGRYTITVLRSGYLQTLYGQQRFGEPGSTLIVEEGQRLDKIDFALQRAGQIAGRISDGSGEPIAGASVSAMQFQYFQGRRALIPMTGTVRTDDTGQYRLPGVPPGDYIVAASSRETWTGDADPKSVFAFAPTYYPGTVSTTDAQRVKVGPSQEATQVDFNLVESRASTVSGTAFAQDGSPLAGAPVFLNAELTGPGGASMTIAGQARVAADGAWVIRAVPPGEYRLTTSTRGRDGTTESAGASITVGSTDVTGVTLVADAGSVFAGEVVTDTGAPLPAGAMRAFAQVPSPDRRPVAPGAGEDGIVRDGAFTFRSASGPAYVRVSPLPPGWGIKHVEIDGRDYADTPFNARGGQRVEGVKVVVSNRLGSVSGRVADDKGAAVPAVVLLVPSDPARWTMPGAVRTDRVDQSGVYRFDIVRPGDYLLFALEHVQALEPNDPEFLERHSGAATPVTVTAAGAAVENLKVRR